LPGPLGCKKLYKAAEEAFKALAIHFNLRDVEKSGKWSVGRLEESRAHADIE
jgi:hypothetical protein